MANSAGGQAWEACEEVPASRAEATAVLYAEESNV